MHSTSKRDGFARRRGEQRLVESFSLPRCRESFEIGGAAQPPVRDRAGRGESFRSDNQVGHWRFPFRESEENDFDMCNSRA